MTWRRPATNCRLSSTKLDYSQRADIVRDPKRVNQRLHTDFEMVMGKRLFYGEVDLGTEAMKVVLKQRARYADPSNLLPEVAVDGKRSYRGVFGLENVFLLYVMSSEKRMQNLQKLSQQVENITLFSTVEAVMRQPNGLIWQTANGKSVRIP